MDRVGQEPVQELGGTMRVLLFTFCYCNGEYVFLKSLTDSVLKNYPDLDVLIIDESPDNLDVKQNRKLNSNKIRVEAHRVNSRVYALSVGLEYAINSGYDYALLADSDVICLPGAIDKMVKCLNEHEKCGIVSPMMNGGGGWPETDVEITKEFVDIGSEIVYDRLEKMHAGKYLTNDVVFKDNIYMTDATFVLFRCSIAKQIGGIDRALLHTSFVEDYAWRMHKAGYTWGVCKTAVVYHCRRGRGLAGVNPMMFEHDADVLRRKFGQKEFEEMAVKARACHS